MPVTICVRTLVIVTVSLSGQQCMHVIVQVSEKSGTNGNVNCFSYFYLQVKRLKMALTLDEMVETLNFGDS
jgi:hypothetical protein